MSIGLTSDLMVKVEIIIYRITFHMIYTNQFII
jgi:hypothetical protein